MNLRMRFATIFFLVSTFTRLQALPTNSTALFKWYQPASVPSVKSLFWNRLLSGFTLLGDVLFGPLTIDVVHNKGATKERIQAQRTPDNVLNGSYNISYFHPKLCDPTSAQISGRINVNTHQGLQPRNLFFWFFESKHAPKDAPLVLWLNGGPGATSMYGLLWEVGPCRFQYDSRTDSFNLEKWPDYAWNNVANVIFLDQPVGVGYSTSTEPESITISEDAAWDVYNFLQIFLKDQDLGAKYANSPFHLVGESYAGHYVPHIASDILIYNEQSRKKQSNNAVINLDSMVLINPMVDPTIQIPYSFEYGCNHGLLLDADCRGGNVSPAAMLASKLARGLQECQADRPRSCGGLSALHDEMWKMMNDGSPTRNKYKIDVDCSTQMHPGCSQTNLLLPIWMEGKSFKGPLGIQESERFHAINDDVYNRFHRSNDAYMNTAKDALVPLMIEQGVRLLVMAGELDWMCDFQGNLNWMMNIPENLHNPITREFLGAPEIAWNSGKEASGTIKIAGVSSSKGGYQLGRYTFARIKGAGHMVPYDRPDAAYDLFTRWITPNK